MYCPIINKNTRCSVCENRKKCYKIHKKQIKLRRKLKTFASVN